jgi:hypothetical protein
LRRSAISFIIDWSGNATPAGMHDDRARRIAPEVKAALNC